MDGWMDDRRTLMNCIAQLKLKELIGIQKIYQLHFYDWNNWTNVSK